MKFDKNVYVPKSWATPNATLRYGDIIFNNTNSQELVGKTGYFDLDDANYVFSNHITRIRVNDRIVMPKYLQIIFNFYQSKQVFYAICTNWNNQSGIGNELLLNLDVPIPPLSIQHEIVEKMDMAYQHKKLKEAESAQILSNIDDYILDRLGIEKVTAETDMQSRIFYTDFCKVVDNRLDPNFYRKEFETIITNLGVFDVKKLTDIVNFSDETWNGEAYFETHFPYIEISEINILYGEIQNINMIPKNEAPSRARMIVRNDDIIISTTRPSRGAIAYVKSEPNEIKIASTGFAVLRDLKTNLIEKDFLFHWLRHSYTLRQMEQRSSGGSYPAITTEELRQVLVPLPPLSIQREIAQAIREMRAKAKDLQGSANDLVEDMKREIEGMIMG